MAKALTELKCANDRARRIISGDSDVGEIRLRPATESVGWMNSQGPLAVSPKAHAAELRSLSAECRTVGEDQATIDALDAGAAAMDALVAPDAPWFYVWAKKDQNKLYVDRNRHGCLYEIVFHDDGMVTWSLVRYPPTDGRCHSSDVAKIGKYSDG